MTVHAHWIVPILMLVCPGRHKIKQIATLFGVSERTSYRIWAGQAEPSAGNLLTAMIESEAAEARVLAIIQRERERRAESQIVRPGGLAAGAVAGRSGAVGDRGFAAAGPASGLASTARDVVMRDRAAS